MTVPETEIDIEKFKLTVIAHDTVFGIYNSQLPLPKGRSLL